MSSRSISLALLVFISSSTPALAKGRLAGRVLDEAGRGIAGVEVILDGTEALRITGRDGSFLFDRVPEGTHSITLSLGRDTRTLAGIETRKGVTASVEVTVDWRTSFAEEITVAASRWVERAADAPAAVTTLSAEAIARESGSGEIPRLLDTAPGVDVVNASGFLSEVNARGFNGYNNRGVQVFLDGVDQSVPFAGFQEYFPRNVMDLASVELVKGPSSSLYGANAFNGVLNLITKPPMNSQGGSVRLTLGDPSFVRGDLRWAGNLGRDWFFKLVGNYQEGEYFIQSRNEATEYPGLPMELLPVPDGKIETGTIGLRFDKQFDDSSLLTLESGHQKLEGNPVAVGFGGRFTTLEPIEQSWLRFGFTNRKLDVRGFFTDRQGPDFIDLATGGHGSDDSQRRHLEILGHDELERLRIVGGASYREDDIGHFVVPEPLQADWKAVFGQVSYELADLRLVISARWDDGTLFDGRVSPRAGLVWGITPRHTVRLTYSEAFQAPTYGEFFLEFPFFVPTAAGPLPAVDLAAVEASLCAPIGVSCGFAMPVGARLVGNQDLEVEEVAAIEVGYNATVAERAFLTVDFYRNELENFITQPLINPFGTFNSRFTPYQPPSGHPDPDSVLRTLQDRLGPLFPFLLQDRDGAPVFIPLGFTNAGRVDTQGIDLALSASVGNEWLIDFTYSWFDFEVKDAGVAGVLFPNTPKHKAAVGFTFTRPRFDVSARFRWVDDFLWGSGIFVGPVPSYEVLNGSGTYTINESLAIGFNITNLLDNEHWETFGGDVLGRRTLLYATVNW
jgi:outer membrane receptor protein involved in Fe transport